MTHLQRVSYFLNSIRRELETIKTLATDGLLNTYGSEQPGGIDQRCAQLRVLVKHMTKRIEQAEPQPREETA